MEPKRAKTDDSSQQSEGGTGPLSLDDLPDLVLSKVLRNLEGLDRLRLTQACPSVRRLCTGPDAEPGVLGSLVIEFPPKPEPGQAEPPVLKLGERALKSGHGTHLSLALAPWLGVFSSSSQAVLHWIDVRSRAFSSVYFTFSSFFGHRHRENDTSSTALLVLTALFRLKAARFSGRIHLAIPYLNNMSIPYWAPVLLFLDSHLSHCQTEILIVHLQASDECVKSLLAQLRNIDSLQIGDLFGNFPAEFSPSRLSSFVIGFNEDGFVVSLSKAIQHLTTLALVQASIDLPPTIRSLSPLSLASLTSVSLRYLSTSKAHDLKSLQELPQLSSLFLRFDGQFDTTATSLALARPDAAVLLPKVRQLEVNVAFGNTEEVPAAVDGTRPLSWDLLSVFHCPQLVFLLCAFNFSSKWAQLTDNKVPALLSLGGIDHFPSMQSLDLSVDSAPENSLTLDLRASELDLLPHLHYLKTRASSVEISPTEAVKLPLLGAGRFISRKDGPLANRPGLTLEFGDRAFSYASLWDQGVLRGRTSSTIYSAVTAWGGSAFYNF